MGKEKENGDELTRYEILRFHIETCYTLMMLSHKLDDRKFVGEEEGGKWD